MINLFLNKGEILLYDADDWSKLRKEYRIIGEIIGNSMHLPSLPIRILPEEACMLIEKNVAIVLESPKAVFKTENEKRKLEEYEDELLEAENVEYKKVRREQLETVADRIIARQNDNRTREQVINDELRKLVPVNRENMIWPIKMSASSSSSYEELKSMDLSEIMKLTTPLKKAVYFDLWNKGYYVSQGDKFGGNFLAYAGDPVCHHALFVVKCVEPTDRLFPMDLIGFGRLGSSVKKKSVWASMDDNNQLSYISMGWKP